MGRKTDRLKIDNVFWSNAILLAILVVASTISMVYMHHTLLKNAQKMGEQIAHSYITEEERNLEIYENMVMMGTQYIENLDLERMTPKQINAGIENYFEQIKKITGSNTVDPYVVINGRIIADKPWEGMQFYNASAMDWYQMALDAEGKVVCTDAYLDSVYKKMVITIAQECGDTGNVLAFDIFPDQYRFHSNKQDLPKGSSYYLFDSKGVMLYGESAAELSAKEEQDYVLMLFEKIRNKELDSEHASLYDMNQKKCKVFYTQSSNGWYNILMIPYHILMQDFWRMLFWYVAVYVVFFAAILVTNLGSRRINKEAKRTEETIRVLGNSYYALYRVDIDRGSYEIIKGSDYIWSCLEKKGNYADFLVALKALMSAKTYEEFVKSFSLENIQEQIEQGEKEFGGSFLRCYQGNEKWVSVHILFEPSMSSSEVVLSFRDIDREKKGQLQTIEMLKGALEEVKRSNQSQKSFFSSMSHEMRTPLNVIIGMSELAEKSVVHPEKIIDYLKKINYSSRQLLELINDILEMSELEQGIILDNEQFDLEESIRECVKIFQTQAQVQEKEFQFRCDIQNRLVYGDSLKLNQIINNLVSNALKYSDKGDQISVTICQKKHQSIVQYQITVADTGIGMSEEFQERIFEPYEREKRFSGKNVEGTGLGMPIVKMIVSNMGGSISIDSTLGEGSTFTVLLPLEVVREEEDVVTEKETEDLSRYTLSGARILLAEDYELNMELATEILKMQGAQVIQAWNGREALETFRESEEFYFDVILMDMQMPEMDGCESASAIRALDRRDAVKVPIIAVTANAYMEDIRRTAEAGMDAHISKPIDIEKLCATLGQLIAVKR